MTPYSPRNKPPTPAVNGGGSAELWQNANVAEQYAHFARAQWYTDVNQRLVDRLEPKKSDTILDWCCGIGCGSRLLDGRVNKVIGIDLSAPMIERAKRSLLGLSSDYTFIEGDVATTSRNLPFTPDGIVCFNSLHLFSDLPSIFSAAAEILPRGGTFAANSGFLREQSSAEASLEGALVAEAIFQAAVRHQPGHRLGHVRAPSLDEVSRAARLAGFEILEIECQPVFISRQSLVEFFTIPGTLAGIMPEGLQPYDRRTIVQQAFTRLDETFLVDTGKKFIGLMRKWYDLSLRKV